MEIVERLIQHIEQEEQANRLVLPSLPEVVIRIRQAMNDERMGVKQIARFIQFDPNLAARILQFANSPRYSTGHKIGSCRAAVAHLGMKVTRDLVTCLVANNIFQTDSKILHTYVKSLWQHSCHVAAISHVLAQITPGLHADQAMLAGLIHDIGVLPVLNYAQKYPELINHPELLEQVIARLRKELGWKVLVKWNFSDDMLNVPIEADHWLRKGGECADYTDVVIVAQVHSLFGTAKSKEIPPLQTLPAFKKLTLSHLGPDASMELLHEAQDEINAVMRMLDVQ